MCKIRSTAKREIIFLSAINGVGRCLGKPQTFHSDETEFAYADRASTAVISRACASLRDQFLPGACQFPTQWPKVRRPVRKKQCHKTYNTNTKLFNTNTNLKQNHKIRNTNTKLCNTNTITQTQLCGDLKLLPDKLVLTT